MKLDVTQPEAHHPWCADRLKPRSQDHWGKEGSPACASELIGGTGPTGVFLIESSHGRGPGPDIAVCETRLTPKQTRKLIKNLQAALAAIEEA